MMKRVLLIKHPYEMASSFLTIRAGIPLRTAYLAAVLKKNKIEYDILDINMESISRHGIRMHDKYLKSISLKKGKVG